ncbi:uncharacterized protein Dvar_50320 [Desulfosarcina variabilis str. Montpellier]
MLKIIAISVDLGGLLHMATVWFGFFYWSGIIKMHIKTVC